jgi:extracellular matrix regulatory protein B
MYIHIGEEVSVRLKDIVAIIDKDSVNASSFMKEFLQHNEQNTENLSKNTFKSIVVTSEKVFYSPISSSTLNKRSNQLYVTDF